MNKPVKAKPIFYANLYEPLKVIAKEYGYNLLLDGSLNRDFDLVLVAWHDKHRKIEDVLTAMENYLGGSLHKEADGTMVSKMIGSAGRKKSIIDLNRSSRFDLWSDDEWYIDITILNI